MMNRIKNVGAIERSLRILGGGLAVLVSLYALLPSPASIGAGVLGVALALLGLDFVVTGLTGYCPLYRRLGWSTAHATTEQPPHHGGHEAHTPGEHVVNSPASGNTVAPVDRWSAPVDLREGTRHEHVQLRIDGLSCAADAVGLEHRLIRHLGVVDAVVNPVTEIAYVTFDPAATGLSALRQSIENAGYSTEERNSTTIDPRDHVLQEA